MLEHHDEAAVALWLRWGTDHKDKILLTMPRKSKINMEDREMLASDSAKWEEDGAWHRDDVKLVTGEGGWWMRRSKRGRGNSYDGAHFIGGDATIPSFEGRRGFGVHRKKNGYCGTDGEEKVSHLPSMTMLLGCGVGLCHE